MYLSEFYKSEVGLLGQGDSIIFQKITVNIKFILSYGATQKECGAIQKGGGATQKDSGATRKSSSTIQKGSGTTEKANEATQKGSGAT